MFKGIHFGKNNPNRQYTIRNQDLFIDTEEKDVGVIFDSTLNFRSHINKMISKANQRVGLIKRSFTRLQPNSFKILYKSLVRPILEYCSVIWFPQFITETREIEKVQRRATRLIPEIRDLDYPDRLKKLNLTTLAYRRQRTDMLQVFRIIKKIDRIPFESFFEYNNNPTRGHSCQLEKPRFNTPLRKNSFSHRVINIWNSLPEEAVQCIRIEKNETAINNFKNAIESAWKTELIKYDFDAWIESKRNNQTIWST